MLSRPDHVNVDTAGAGDMGQGIKGIGPLRNNKSFTWIVGATLGRRSSNSPSSSDNVIKKHGDLTYNSKFQYTDTSISRQYQLSYSSNINNWENLPVLQTSHSYDQRGLLRISSFLRGRNLRNYPPLEEEILEIRNSNITNIDYQMIDETTNQGSIVTIKNNLCQSSFESRLLNKPSPVVDSVLASACKTVGFDIAEMWLRTGPKTHQLTNTHLRPTSLDETVRNELVDVYYGERSSERTHRLSPALCKRATAAMDVVWVTAYTENGAKTLRCSISDVRTAVAVPVCHKISNSNITIIFFSIRRSIMKPSAVEFLVHISLAAAIASVNDLADDIMTDRVQPLGHLTSMTKSQNMSEVKMNSSAVSLARLESYQSVSNTKKSYVVARNSLSSPMEIQSSLNLNIHWECLRNMEYLTDGGYSWIHTAVMNGKPVVVKTLKPECQDLAIAINEIEGELEIHRHLIHLNIVSLCGAGMTSKGSRFIILERLDGGTLSQYLGYSTRIRDRRRRFWKKSKMSYVAVLKCAKSIADAMKYCNERAINGSMVLHRDLKPDNIGFTLDGTVKLIDFGLAKVVENASSDFNDVYEMSGKTGSFRYMAPKFSTSKP